jgi:hypothetical protein
LCRQTGTRKQWSNLTFSNLKKFLLWQSFVVDWGCFFLRLSCLKQHC